MSAESDAYGVFNIGRGESNTINDLAKTIPRIMGKDLKPEYQLPRPVDIRYTLAGISKARTIDYEPQYSLEYGLRETIKRTRNAK